MHSRSRADMIHNQIRAMMSRKIEDLPEEFYEGAEKEVENVSDKQLISLSKKVDRFYKVLASIIDDHSEGNNINMEDIFSNVANDGRIQEEFAQAKEVAMEMPSLFIPIIIGMEAAPQPEEKMNILTNFYVLADAITSHFSPELWGDVKFIKSPLKEEVPLFSYN